MMWGIVFHNTPMQTPHGLNIAPILMSIWIHSIWKEDENETASTKTQAHIVNRCGTITRPKSGRRRFALFAAADVHHEVAHRERAKKEIKENKHNTKKSTAKNKLASEHQQQQQHPQ